METCNILGVNVNAINMGDTISFIESNLKEIKGNYICVSNVHTTVMAYEDVNYKNIQNGGVMALPDGKPLSVVSKLKGYKKCERVTGPDLMECIFEISEKKGYKHFFYGSTEETLKKLKKELNLKFKDLNIVGMYSPPFRELSEKEEIMIISEINKNQPDFVWVGLGAPKQEIWMNKNKNKINGLMIGVGAGFDYHAKNIKRAPNFMQNAGLEWLYRLLQDPKRLFKRYLVTNTKFIYLNLKKY